MSPSAIELIEKGLQVGDQIVPKALSKLNTELLSDDPISQINHEVLNLGPLKVSLISRGYIFVESNPYKKGPKRGGVFHTYEDLWQDIIIK